MPHLVQIFKCVADGLVHMHRRQVCHGDLKPNNILLSRAGDVKVIDYGLARIRGEAVDRVQGTPEYMAPEQTKHSLINERTDIYNFGATMYRLVTWRLPPSTVSEEDGGLPIDAKMWKRMFKPVEELVPATPPALVELIHRCLSFEAPKRPERMSEVQGALDHLVDELASDPEDQLETMEW
jgi:serine/threonine protein kinase